MIADTDLKDRNLDVLRRLVPHLIGPIRDFTPKTQLVQAGDDWDIVENETSRFDGPVVRHFERQMTAFKKNRVRLASPEPQAGGADFFTNRLGARLSRRVADAGIPLIRDHSTDTSYFLVVFGIGLGQHLDELIAFTGCRRMILIDANLECLNHSLSVFDWGGFAAGLEAQGRRFDIIVTPDPAAMARELGLVMRAANPTGLDGATVFMDQDDEGFRDAFSRFLATEAVKVPHALGCYNDERIMLRNSLFNLSQPSIRLLDRTRAPRVPHPVFVIGAGPSLDDSLSVIRDNGERAIIVSCGSALRPLLAGGVRPDFHVEVENLGVEPILIDARETGETASICLIAPTTVEPAAHGYFDRALSYFKFGSTPDAAFRHDPGTALALTEPGVANAAVSFALASGAPEIYFFGLDLGVRDAGRHHAANTYHLDGGEFFDKRDYEYSMPTEANFGGPFLTSPFLDLTRTAIMLAIGALAEGRRVFNCSDGALIGGAQPLRPDAIALAPPPDKQDAIEALIEAMPLTAADTGNGHCDLGALDEAITEVIDGCRTAIAESPSLMDKAYLDPMMARLRVAQYVHPAAGRTPGLAASLTVRGTVLNYLLVTEYLINRASDGKARSRLEEIIREELAAALDELQGAAARDILDLAGWFPGRDSEAGAGGGYGDGEMIPEASLTWTNVGRNAPCPCGSGRRFKHCHGRQ